MAMSNDRMSIWHQGELAVQQMVGTDKQMEKIGHQRVREFMPQQHRDFFQSLSMLFIGYTDHYSNIYTTVLFGSPSFIQSPTETELVINTQHSMGDFMRVDVNIGDRIGLLGIEFDTKRRNRLNGIITDVNQKNITVRVLQSYGNCPKYIQPKTFKTNRDYSKFTTTNATRFQLNHIDRKIISSADTFFIASCFNDDQKLNNRGVDMSHRGGTAGFVSINAKGQLLVNDYPGNGFFNTLGNLFENSIASLLFCDWVEGHALQITVSSEILWHDDEHQEKTVLITKESSKQIKAIRTLCFTPIKIKLFTNVLAYRQHITDNA
jgi:predicted pyridoxine 5'-phosphate oxidase superfamily flavin-nucleotide-binding protein